MKRIALIALLCLLSTLPASCDMVTDIQTLAEQGDVEARFMLATMYRFGRGVSQDYAEAVKWYRMAAEQGDAKAQYNLALM